MHTGFQMKVWSFIFRTMDEAVAVFILFTSLPVSVLLYQSYTAGSAYRVIVTNSSRDLWAVSHRQLPRLLHQPVCFDRKLVTTATTCNSVTHLLHLLRVVNNISSPYCSFRPCINCENINLSVVIIFKFVKDATSRLRVLCVDVACRFLCLQNKLTAEVCFNQYTSQHPQVERGPPFVRPLLNFLWMLLLAVDGYVDQWRRRLGRQCPPTDNFIETVLSRRRNLMALMTFSCLCCRHYEIYNYYYTTLRALQNCSKMRQKDRIPKTSWHSSFTIGWSEPCPTVYMQLTLQLRVYNHHMSSTDQRTQGLLVKWAPKDGRHWYL